MSLRATAGDCAVRGSEGRFPVRVASGVPVGVHVAQVPLDRLFGPGRLTSEGGGRGQVRKSSPPSQMNVARICVNFQPSPVRRYSWSYQPPRSAWLLPGS